MSILLICFVTLQVGNLVDGAPSDYCRFRQVNRLQPAGTLASRLGEISGRQERDRDYPSLARANLTSGDSEGN
jgi:hypothetical protein